MNISQINLFNDVSELGTISEAAKINNMSQPAASKQLQNLEDYFGVCLFERTNRGIILTEAGQILYDFTKKVSRMNEELHRNIRNIRNNKNSIDIVACPVVAGYVLPNLICELKKDYPHFNFNITSRDTQLTVDTIISGTYSLGFALDVPPRPELVSQKMFDDEIVLVSCRDYEISDHLTFEELSDHLVIVSDECYVFYDKIRDYFKDNGVDVEEINYFQTFYSIESVKNLLVNCSGIAFMPRKAMANEIRKGLVREIDLEGFESHYSVYAITHTKNTITPLMMKIIGGVEKQGRK